MWLSIALLQILTLFQNCLEMLFRTANEHQLTLSTVERLASFGKMGKFHRCCELKSYFW